jgi:hypothetical protein
MSHPLQRLASSNKIHLFTVRGDTGLDLLKFSEGKSEVA